MRFVLSILALLCLTATVPLYSQPAIDWIKTYHERGYESLSDIYCTYDDGYMMCGGTSDEDTANSDTKDMWLIRIDEMGREQWSGVYGFADAADHGKSGCCEMTNADWKIRNVVSMMPQ